MGYTTKFTGSICLSRPLTLAEARELLEMRDDNKQVKEVMGVDTYMQWVPTESLDAIVWDGEEKFYEYVPLMRGLCAWLDGRGIAANGELLWSGESAGDVGQIVVTDNAVQANEGRKAKARPGKPLTLERLGAMALDLATKGAA